MRRNGCCFWECPPRCGGFSFRLYSPARPRRAPRSSPECPADGSSSCPSHNKPSGGTVTVPALRQLNGEWGADCTKRIYYVTSGTWSSSEVFIPAGSYTEVTYYNWPGGFMYKGAFHTYP